MPVDVLRCRICESEYPAVANGICVRCFGPLEPVYDWDELARTRHARADRGGAALALALRRPAARRAARGRRPAARVHAARPGAAARAARSGVGEVLPQARPREPDALVQGPRRRRRRGEGARSSGSTRSRRPRPATSRTRSPRARPRSGMRGGDLLPGRARAGEARRRRRSTARRSTRVRGSYDDCSPPRQRARRRGRLGHRQRQPALLLRRGLEDARVRDRRAARLGDARRGRDADRLGRDVHEGLAGLRAVPPARARRAARCRSSSAARPRAARPVATAFAEDRRVTPVRPDTSSVSSIAIGNPADGDLAVATREGVGRRRSTPCPRTRSARTSRCSPRPPASSARAATGVAVGALRAAVAARRARRGRPRRRARHRHRPEDAAGSPTRPARSSRSSPTSTRCSRSSG